MGLIPDRHHFVCSDRHFKGSLRVGGMAASSIEDKGTHWGNILDEVVLSDNYNSASTPGISF